MWHMGHVKTAYSRKYLLLRGSKHILLRIDLGTDECAAADAAHSSRVDFARDMQREAERGATLNEVPAALPTEEWNMFEAWVSAPLPRGVARLKLTTLYDSRIDD